MNRIARLGAVTSGLALVAAACGGGTHREAAAVRRAPRATTTSTTTTTTLRPTTTTTGRPVPAGLGIGASGPQVLALQQRLAALHYDVAKVDGNFGGGTMQAVMAFQKVNGMARTGRATDDVLARLATASAPAPMVPGGGSTRVEVDVARQVLFLYRGGALDKIVAVSTGSGQRYCVGGACATALTPGGSYRVRAKVGGWQTGRLGRLYKPSYFNGGIAIHGALSVPGGPASHGCVRVPMVSADWLFAALPVGTPVYVLNGPKAPVPFDEPAPTNLAPDPNQTSGDDPSATTTTTTTTTTTVPPSSTSTSSTTTTTAPPGP